MPYIKSVCRAGRTKEIAKYYTWRYQPERKQRREKLNKTTETQQKINDRQTEQKLTRIMNANFDDSSWYVTFSYTKENRPDSETLKRHKRKLLSDLRKIYKENGLELKYIETAEIGKRGAAHLHMVITDIDIRCVKKLWNYGYVHAIPLDNSGQYRKLASYFIKYYQKTRGTDEQLQKKAYNCSRNLKRPVPEKQIMRGRRFKKDIDIPKGWYLDKGSVYEGVTADGYEYMSYTLVQEKIETSNRTKKRRQKNE